MTTSNRIDDEHGEHNTPGSRAMSFNMMPSERGGFGHESPTASGDSGMLSSALPGNPHSMTGFKRAIKRTQRSSGRLIDKVGSYGGGGGPVNRFAQGGRRHGLHLGAGQGQMDGPGHIRLGGRGGFRGMR